MTRYRAVLDTNVIVSAFLFGGKPKEILDLAIAARIECFSSESIMEELKRVLSRPKFGLSNQECLHIMEEVNTVCKVVEPSISVHAVNADPDDNAILECALAVKAHAVVTGDTHLLALERYGNIEIVSPTGFIEKCAP